MILALVYTEIQITYIDMNQLPNEMDRTSLYTEIVADITTRNKKCEDYAHNMNSTKTRFELLRTGRVSSTSTI